MTDSILLHVHDHRGRRIGELSVEEILLRRHELRVRWCEPHPARDSDGALLDADVCLDTTVHDGINLMRGSVSGKPHAFDDRELLLDFVAIHFAKIINHG